jgi:hypothetical protein
METFAGQLCEYFLERWQDTTSYEYCVASAVIVCSGWLVSRFSSH